MAGFPGDPRSSHRCWLPADARGAPQISTSRRLLVAIHLVATAVPKAGDNRFSSRCNAFREPATTFSLLQSLVHTEHGMAGSIQTWGMSDTPRSFSALPGGLTACHLETIHTRPLAGLQWLRRGAGGDLSTHQRARARDRPAQTVIAWRHETAAASLGWPLARRSIGASLPICLLGRLQGTRWGRHNGFDLSFGIQALQYRCCALTSRTASFARCCVVRRWWRRRRGMVPLPPIRDWG